MWSESKFATAYREYFIAGKAERCVGMTILATLYAECHVIWDHQFNVSHAEVFIYAYKVQRISQKHNSLPRIMIF